MNNQFSPSPPAQRRGLVRFAPPATKPHVFWNLSVVYPGSRSHEIEMVVRGDGAELLIVAIPEEQVSALCSPRRTVQLYKCCASVD
jgi:hypothetical protein